jgi:lysophospholipase L1-like esterase
VTAPARRRRRLVARLPAFRRSYAQVEAYAAQWERANAAALAAQGPLWVVLGDSAAQGVGASGYDRGWVGLVRERLAAADRRPWRGLNLSRSGARTRDVVDVQWPRAQQLLDGNDAELLTAVVGGNDALGNRLDRWLHDLDDLCAALPRQAVVATVARGVFERKTRRANEHLRRRAAEHGLRVADLWAHTGPPYHGRYADGFHPNDAGYRQWADAVGEAIGL